MGNIISKKDKILQRWKDYFETILNNHTTENLLYSEAYREEEEEEEEEEILEPSYTEMREIIKK
jgi:Ran GTPase-activating protein (RanGAP) involved in mRNA processing and transport